MQRMGQNVQQCGCLESDCPEENTRLAKCVALEKFKCCDTAWVFMSISCCWASEMNTRQDNSVWLWVLVSCDCDMKL